MFQHDFLMYAGTLVMAFCGGYIFSPLRFGSWAEEYTTYVVTFAIFGVANVLFAQSNLDPLLFGFTAIAVAMFGMCVGAREIEQQH